MVEDSLAAGRFQFTPDDGGRSPAAHPPRPARLHFRPTQAQAIDLIATLARQLVAHYGLPANTRLEVTLDGTLERLDAPPATEAPHEQPTA